MQTHTIRGHFELRTKKGKNYYLNQTDLANNWKQILPMRNLVKSEEKDMEFENKMIYNEVNLAQFPPYMYYKIKSSKDIYFDNFFKFRLLKTEQDDLIKELYNLIQVDYPNLSQKKQMKELVHILEEYSIEGWVIIKAKNKMV